MNEKRYTNPYRTGGTFYKIIEVALRRDPISGKRNPVTRKQLESMGFPIDDITTVLTPRLEGEGKGDPRGSISAKGHLYYFKRLKKDFIGDEQRFVFGYRAHVLPPLRRIPKRNVTSQKAKKEKEKELVEV